MSVERLPSGGWRARWRDAQGNERSKGSRHWRKRDAEAFERKMLAQRDDGITLVAHDLTVAELAEMWLTASRHLAESTVRSVRDELRRDILPVLGSMRIKRVKPADIDAYLSGLAQAGRASTTQRRHLMSILSPMFKFARSRGFITVSPTTDVKRPRLDQREMRFLSMSELHQLAMAFPERYQNLIIFTGIMGPRWGEVWSLTPAHFEGPRVFIPGTKTKAARRRVMMPKFIQDLMAEQLERWATPECMWPTKQGTKPNAKGWRQRVWGPSLRRSGVPHLRFHDLRHTAAALAIASGAHPVLVQRRLGHANMTVTLGVYGHLFPEADEDVADRLDAAWRDTDEETPRNP